MPNYVGSTYDFARSNLIEIYGIKEANIELRKTEHLPDGVVVSAGQVSVKLRSFSTVDINRTRIVLTVYEPKVTASSSTKASSSSDTSSSSSAERSDTESSSSSATSGD